MNAEILAFGSELVNGQKLDTNSQWLAGRLGDHGIEVRFHTTVGDVLEDTLAALRIALGRAHLVITTGGLGPTQDDLTRQALAEVAGVPLIEDLEALRAIEGFFARRNRVMTERNRVQALFPRGADPLPNRVGTAPGIWMALDRSIVVCLPGVPHELHQMFEEEVLPRLRRIGAVRRIFAHRVINLFGKGESEIEQHALDLTSRGRIPEVGITASDATISFRITAEGPNETEALRAIEPTAEQIYQRFGELIVGEGNTDVAESLAAQLERTGLSLATAESCTGGLIAHRLTSIPGISAWYRGGMVTYAESAKTELLGISPELIRTHGVVSAEVAQAMADGVRRRLSADVGIGVTGVAGPGPDTHGNPAGLVYLGLATPEGVTTRKLEIGPEQPRHVIQSRAAKSAMNLARLDLSRRPGRTQS
jgi:nicotinamide-nucleotide amidase